MYKSGMSSTLPTDISTGNKLWAQSTVNNNCQIVCMELPTVLLNLQGCIHFIGALLTILLCMHEKLSQMTGSRGRLVLTGVH